MRLLMLVALLATPLAAAERPVRAPALPACKNPGTQLVDGKRPRARVHPLDQEPPAKQVLTVMRTVNGCVKPVVVREDIGKQPAR